MEFWLSYNNGAEKLRLPVNPPSLSVKSPFGMTDVDVVQLGQFTIIGDRELESFSFESFFPKEYNPSYCEYAGFPTPLESMEMIKRWRNTRKPIRFIVTETNINHAVTIRGDFPHDIVRAGSIGDIYYSLELKQFEFLNLKQEIDINDPSAKADARPPVVNVGSSDLRGKTYTVKKNDTLTKIAFDVYRDSSKFKDIHQLNKSLIGADPNKIQAGMKLVLPK